MYRDKSSLKSNPATGPLSDGEAREESFFGRDWRGLTLLLVLCGVVIVLRWVKIEALYNNDTSMWLFQVGRLARGELPYRDFSWNYPPLAIFLLGSIARVFGITFSVLQATMDIISLAVVLLCWWLARHILPACTRFVTIAATVAVCATSLTKFNLFSFATYSPALEIAAAGLLMVMIGGVRQLKSGASAAADFALISAGIFIATISKPEALAAGWSALILLVALDRTRRWNWYIGAAAAAGAASTLVYVWTARLVGFGAMKTGIGGYGLASFACPWWPTGLGLYGAVACTGEAAFLAAVLIWPFRRSLRPEYARRISFLWGSGAIGLAVFAAYVWYQCGPELLLSTNPTSLKMEALARNVIWTSPALLPIMWASICVWVALLLQWRRMTLASQLLFFVISVPVAMSVRSLFGSTLFPVTEVSAMCYPFFVIAAALLIEALYRVFLAERGASATVAIWIVLGGYGALRFAGAFPTQLSNAPYYSLRTRAGTVRLSDGRLSEQIYHYIVDRTSPDDALFDLPYGGGFNFAAGLRSPAFTVQFQQLRMPEEYQMRDLDQLRADPPRYIIANPAQHFASWWGYNSNMDCPFPRFVWQPDEPSWDPGYVFPVVRYIEQNYKVGAKIGPKLILVPR